MRPGGGLFEILLNHIRILAVLRDIRLLDGMALGIERVIVLNGDQQVIAADFAHFQAVILPQRRQKCACRKR